MVKFQPFERIPDPLLHNNRATLVLQHRDFQNHDANRIIYNRYTGDPAHFLGTSRYKIFASFKLIFLSHYLLLTKFERFGACHAAFMLNFPKHQNFSNFCCILEEPFQQGSLFFRHPVYCRAKLNMNTQIKFQLCVSLLRKSF